MRISDWSSDVCSSDLDFTIEYCRCTKYCRRILGSLDVSFDKRARIFLERIWKLALRHQPTLFQSEECNMSQVDRKSVVSGKSVSVRVDLGGRRIIKKKKTTYDLLDTTTTQYK